MPSKLRRIRFRQTGGFAGLVRGCELAPEALGAGEREELVRLARESGLVAAPGGAPAPGTRGTGRDRARDTMRYEIEIESEAGVVRVVLDDLDLPEKVAPLVAYLQKHSRPMPLE